MRTLHEQLRTAILDRRLGAGTLLPSTRRVAESYGIARNSVIGAYDPLIAEGYVLPRRGAKAVVADVAAHRPAAPRHRVRAPLEVNPVWLLPQFQPRPPRNSASRRAGSPSRPGGTSTCPHPRTAPTVAETRSTTGSASWASSTGVRMTSACRTPSTRPATRRSASSSSTCGRPTGASGCRATNPPRRRITRAPAATLPTGSRTCWPGWA